MKKKTQTSQNYILLPLHKTVLSRGGNPNVSDFLNKLAEPAAQLESFSLSVRNRPEQPAGNISLNVLDSIADNGAKLIKINDEDIASFRFSYPGLRMVPEKHYQPAFIREQLKSTVQQSAVNVSPVVKITDAAGKGIAGVQVTAFTDFAARVGAGGKTDKNGQVTLQIDTDQVEALYVYPDHSYWGALQNNLKLSGTYTVTLTPIDISVNDCLRYFYDTKTWPVITQKVRVGIIDTGVGPHHLLTVKGGLNCVKGEDPKDFGDNGEGHGTHVGGIVGAAGNLPGVAWGAEIMSYRVFPKAGGGEGASSFDIMKAIKQATKDKCDLINMSLGQPDEDEGISTAVKEAYEAGILCFCANGNDGKEAILYPAAYSLSLAVSAMGRIGTFPAGSVETGAVKAPFGTDKKNFIGDFSNFGSKTNLTAPGVGIISTYPGGTGDYYAVMDGTSMATPAATGMAARLLSGVPNLLNLPRNSTRADEMIKFLSAKFKLMGFGANFEGKGMLFLP